MEITEYAKTLAEAGFEVWHTPGRMGGYLTYRDPSQGTWGTLQYSDYGGWQHLMPLVPSREYGSAMFIGEPLDIWTVEAARQCASPTNHNEIIGTRPNAGTAWLSHTATRIEA